MLILLVRTLNVLKKRKEHDWVQKTGFTVAVKPRQLGTINNNSLRQEGCLRYFCGEENGTHDSCVPTQMIRREGRNLNCTETQGI